MYILSDHPLHVLSCGAEIEGDKWEIFEEESMLTALYKVEKLQSKVDLMTWGLWMDVDHKPLVYMGLTKVEAEY